MRAVINTLLNTNTTLTAGATIPVGTIVHKAGCGITAGGNAINIKGAGYYFVMANVTVNAAAATPLTVTMKNNGVAVASATVVPAAIGDPTSYSLGTVIYNDCGCSNSAITLEVEAAGTVTESNVIAERI